MSEQSVLLAIDGHVRTRFAIILDATLFPEVVASYVRTLFQITRKPGFRIGKHTNESDWDHRGLHHFEHDVEDVDDEVTYADT